MDCPPPINNIPAPPPWLLNAINSLLHCFNCGAAFRLMDADVGASPPEVCCPHCMMPYTDVVPDEDPITCERCFHTTNVRLCNVINTEPACPNCRNIIEPSTMIPGYNPTPSFKPSLHWQPPRWDIYGAVHVRGTPTRFATPLDLWHLPPCGTARGGPGVEGAEPPQRPEPPITVP